MADSAERWLKQGDVTHAVALVQQAIAQYPERLQDWLVFGKALSQAGWLVEAEDALRRAVQIEPDSVADHTELDSTLFAQAKYSEAAARYRGDLRINPMLAEAWFNMGLCLMNHRDSMGALEPFQNAPRFKPDLPCAYIRWGQALGRLKRVTEAIVQLQAALQLARPIRTRARCWPLFCAASHPQRDRPRPILLV